MTRALSRSLVCGLAIAAIASTAADAFADRIRCASRDYRYAYCDTPGRVVAARVVKRYSKRPCLQNYTWGIENGGIWVDDGCDAEFDVAIRGGGGGPRPPYATRPPIADAPSWAIGEWRGEGYRFNVYRGGSVVLARGGRYDRGYINDNEVILNDGSRLIVDRDRRGMRLVWPGGRRIYLTRDREYDYR
jgi:hypothetical protein